MQRNALQRFLPICATLLSVVTTSCTTSGFRRQVKAPEPSSFLTPSGTRVWDLAQGTGAAAILGSTVELNVVAAVQGSAPFDSSYARGTPERFQIGAGQTLPGLEEGVIGMRAGGKRKLLVPPEQGFGAQGSGDLVPPNATLVLEVELLAVTE